MAGKKVKTPEVYLSRKEHQIIAFYRSLNDKQKEKFENKVSLLTDKKDKEKE